jgi:hypothetical protein
MPESSETRTGNNNNNRNNENGENVTENNNGKNKKSVTENNNNGKNKKSVTENGRTNENNNGKKETSTSFIKGSTTTKIVIGIVSIISFSMFIASFVSTAQIVGGKDDWNLIQSQVGKILILTLIGTVCFTIAVMVFCHTLEDPDIIYILILL